MTLLRIVGQICAEKIKAAKTISSTRKPQKEVLDEMFHEAADFWNQLAVCNEEIEKVLGSDPTRRLAGDYRKTGGHLLFRPIGQHVFAGAVAVLRKGGMHLPEAVELCSTVPMQLAEKPWRHTMWAPGEEGEPGRMRNGNRALCEAMLLYMIGHNPRDEKYDMWKAYGNVLGDLEWSREDIPLLT